LLKADKHSVYFFLSSGVVGFLLALKCYFGLRFFWFASTMYKVTLAEERKEESKK
jgi:hypothetical protein